jgi:hypothetical protein
LKTGWKQHESYSLYPAVRAKGETSSGRMRIDNLNVVCFLLAVGMAFSLVACGLPKLGEVHYSPTVSDVRFPQAFVGHRFALVQCSYFLASSTAQGMWDYASESRKLQQGRIRPLFPNNEYKDRCGIVDILSRDTARSKTFGPKPSIRVLVTNFAKADTAIPLVQVKFENTDYAGQTFWIPAWRLVRAFEVR